MASIERIAICGGGIGGLTLAGVLCQNSNISVDIYETKPVLTDIGAGIGIWKRSWEVVQSLGLEEEVAKRKLPFPREASGPIFRKAGQPEPGFDFHNHVMPYGPTSIPRPMLIDMLKSKLDPKKCAVHTNKRLTEHRLNPTNGAITLVFADGTTATADVLVGADGVHSMTRATMYRSLAKANPEAKYDQLIDPIWSGTHAYRCSVDLAKFKALYPDHQALLQPKIVRNYVSYKEEVLTFRCTVVWKKQGNFIFLMTSNQTNVRIIQHVVTVPIPPIQVINVIGYYSVETGEGTPYDGPWVSDVSTEEVINAYEGFEPDLMLLLKHIGKPSRWAIHVTRQLPLSVDGKIALLGDAAHAMTPHQGVGGGQAMEDAHILGHLLAHPKANISNVEEILRIYQEIRLPFVAKAVERSRNNGLIYEFIHPDYPVKDDATPEELKVLGETIGETFKWLGRGGCDDDLKKAENLFLSRCIDV